MDSAAYLAFVKARVKDLRKIAARTRGGLSADDLASEAWLAAEYRSAKQGSPIDWHDPKDQDLILGTLTVQHVWRKRGDIRTISADEEREDHEGYGGTILDLLQADDASDPLVLLERREDEELESAKRAEEEAVLDTYSQSVAYTIVLWRFDNIRIRVATYLAIHRGTLRSRIAQAAATLRVQPSLFDRIEKISESFAPSAGRSYAITEQRHLAGSQLVWDFGAG